MDSDVTDNADRAVTQVILVSYCVAKAAGASLRAPSIEVASGVDVVLLSCLGVLATAPKNISEIVSALVARPITC